MELNIPIFCDNNKYYRNTINEKLKFFFNNYKINNYYSEQLDIFRNYDVVFLCNDSKIMNSKITGGKYYKTFWNELKVTSKLLITLTTIYNKQGINIFSLNRGIFKNVNYEEDIEEILYGEPYGNTSIFHSLPNILTKYKLSKKPLLIIIATYDIITNDVSYIEELINKNDNVNEVKVSILNLCNNTKNIEQIKEYVCKIPNFYCLGNYNYEQTKIKFIKGRKYKYLLADHIMRLIIETINKKSVESKDNISKLNNHNENCIIN